MDTRYILTRAISVIICIVIGLYGFGYFKKKQRESAIISELKSISSPSFFYRQFSPEGARKTLISGIVLVAEAKQLGLEPDAVIDRALGIEKKYFATDDENDGLDASKELIRTTLRANYENFVKIGYSADFHTLESLKNGELPPVRTGSFAGRRAEIVPIIDPALSPGLDTVVANLEIRPERKEQAGPATDVEIAITRRLVAQLKDAGVIEDNAMKRILDALSPKPEEPEPKDK